MWIDALDGLAVLVGLALLCLLLLAVRRRVVQRGAAFDCSCRRDRKRFGRGWVLGVARYAGDRVEWYRVFSLSPRPREVFPRDELRIRRRRTPEYPEDLAVLAGHVILECRVGGFDVDLAMSPDALTGFVVWLETAPPGRNANVT
jgi:hypothetical protein